MIKITNPDSPYYGQEAVIIRVRNGVHVDLLVEVAGGPKMTIDATWTDYEERQGKRLSNDVRPIGVKQARRMIEVLGRWKRQSESDESPDKM